MFKVNTDENFFNRFKQLESKINRLSEIFQNEGIELSAEEFGDWNILSKEVEKELKKCIKEGYHRIVANQLKN